jgi:DNA-binding PadR family transcriptional regulator
MHPQQSGRRQHTPDDLRSALRFAMGGGGGGHGRHRHRGTRGRSSGFSFGGMGSGGPWRARKARRGDIRSAALLLLFEEPRNGYQIMQEVEERSGGLWSPSPGSVYPALQQLEDEGLIRADEIDGRKLFTLTDSGREQVEQRDAARPAPWDEIGGELGGQRMQLGQALRAVAAAAAQVIRTGSDTQIAQAQKILGSTRRDLYRVLADDGEEVVGDGAEQ